MTSSIKSHDSEAFLIDKIVENIPYFVFWKDRQSLYLGANELFAKSAGFNSVEALVGKSDFDGCWTREEAEFFRKIDKQVMDSGEAILNIEEQQKQLDGSTSTLLTSKVPLFNSEGVVTGILGIYTDITERKNLENGLSEALENLKNAQTKVIQSEKLKSLGEMAGGIAHEINNPLAIVKGYSEVLKNMISGDEEYNEKIALRAVEKIDLTVDRITKIVNSLKNISREPNPLDIEEVDALEIIEEVKNLCSERIKNLGISLKIENNHSKKASPLLCERVSLSQALINLINNSVDELSKYDEKWILIRLKESEEYFEISVSDSGPKIPEEIQDRLFQPFFTTKEVGKGTGIGLSISKSLLKNQGADLFYDKKSKNNCFVIQYSNKN